MAKAKGPKGKRTGKKRGNAPYQTRRAPKKSVDNSHNDNGDVDSYVINDTKPSPRADSTTEIQDLRNTVVNLAQAVTEMREIVSGGVGSLTPPMEHLNASDNGNAQQQTGIVPLPFVNTDALSRTEQVGNHLLSSKGIPADHLPHIEVVSSAVKAQIISGKDVNLAALLIPGFNGDIIERVITVGSDVYPLKPLTDTRLNKSLTLGEFVKALGVYMSVMCSTYPQRREELNQYLADLVDMSSQFAGFGFYDYHRLFSAKAAAALAKRIKVDWSKRDTMLYTTIFAGQKANACEICKSISHVTAFCGHTLNKNNYSGPGNANRREKDVQGRSISYFQNKQICNNFNAGRCKLSSSACFFAHVCSKCKDPSHAACQEKCKVPGLAVTPVTAVKSRTGDTELATNPGLNTIARGGSVPKNLTK